LYHTKKNNMVNIDCFVLMLFFFLEIKNGTVGVPSTSISIYIDYTYTILFFLPIFFYKQT
jgi:hypothetical protein